MPGTATGRLRVLMMPAVTVASRPYGEPTATTAWPTSMSSDLPSVAVGRSETSLALISAMSIDLSKPTISASAVLPSLKKTSIVPSMPSKATW